MEKPDNKAFSVDIDADVAKGTYSNLVLIAHSPTEFVLDFASALPGMKKPLVASRIIMTPEHAKRLLTALQDNIMKYESNFGDIDMDFGQPKPKSTFNFNDFGPMGGNGDNNKS